MPDDAPVDVSVLVPAYNHEPYVEACLDSVLAQRFDGTLEVVVGEDHSPDGTLAVVRSVAARDPRVRVVTDDRNVGMHANNSRLLRAARGRYVAYCEGDDLWHDPTKLQQQVAHLEAHPELSGVHSDVDHLVGTRRGWVRRVGVWSAAAPDRRPVTTLEDLLRRNVVQTCSVVMRREAIVDYPDSALAAATYAVEDWPMFLHATSRGPLGLLDASLATYRRVEGSVTNAGADANHRRIADQLRMLTDAAALHPDLAAAAQEGLTRTVDDLVLHAVLAGRRDLLQRALVAADERLRNPTASTRAGRVLAAVPGLLAFVAATGRMVLAVARLRAYRRDVRATPDGGPDE
ncbi:glycosyltransferase [Phycicoccus avicenniae]|uniref:glycosyltransferase n=1 Tax=Phycicoccus avicenniae TaxID=2828860 RepID=UPI003D29E516